MAAADRLESLSLFYPMYNEEGNIEEAVRRAFDVLPRHAGRFEVILVDDGSRDATGEIAERIAAQDPRVRAVHHPRNLGYGAALQSGIRASRCEWIFYTDGDNQFDLEEIARLLPLRHQAEIVTGYRIDRSDPLHRRVNALLFNLAVRVLFGLRCRDVDCAFKLYRASIFEGMELVSRGAMIDVEILARARKAGARISEVGVHHYPRTAGAQTGAKLSVILRAFRELFRLWRILR
ncbi:MAG: glycosyltransferase family 2 protein [Candidatus Eisenbacteria bacterium]|nr:glycosyltransferase family 2 protein [Candidatus Eisenbacteria bacterium]